MIHLLSYFSKNLYICSLDSHCNPKRKFSQFSDGEMRPFKMVVKNQNSNSGFLTLNASLPVLHYIASEWHS
jgi:hypothetical protein